MHTILQVGNTSTKKLLTLSGFRQQATQYSYTTQQSFLEQVSQRCFDVSLDPFFT